MPIPGQTISRFSEGRMIFFALRKGRTARVCRGSTRSFGDCHLDAEGGHGWAIYDALRDPGRQLTAMLPHACSAARLNLARSPPSHVLPFRRNPLMSSAVEELCQVSDVKSERTQMWLPSLPLEPGAATVF